MIGETIGHYKIDAEIGRGGMGVVYRAEDTSLHCHRALKFLPTTVTPDSPEHIRLVNEARALAALEHPNICPVQEIGEHKGQTFIVMSYLEGQTLKERLVEGPVPQDEALEITRQILAALAAAHARGIVHRDVKPDNVMLLKDGDRTEGRIRVMLMDFGIAKKHDSTLVTRTGTVMGTAAYMSPEQATGEKVDAASDVWAAGVILYEMLVGERPFQGDLEPAVMYAIVNTDPEPLTGPGKDVPEPVERVVGQALAKDRKNRYADAEAMLADLNLAAEGLTVSGRRLVRRRRGPWIGASVGVLSLLLLALFVWPGFLTTGDAISTLAVMPLEDRSGDPDRAYFAEGVADEMQKGLSKIGALTIVSRSSASQAREIYDTNREIGDRLGVDALVEGSVQREGDRVRVSVQLVATEDDRLLWSESYTRDMRDILNLQSEIALAVSAALETHLTPGEQENLERDRQIDPEAFEELLLGRHFTSIATAESTEKAIEHYKRALAIEPDWALAHYEIPNAYLLNQQMAGLPPKSIIEKIRYHDDRAAKLDPDSAEIIATKGFDAWQVDWDLEAAGKYLARARELNPNFGMMGYAQFLNTVGRHQDALDEALLAVKIDPMNPFRLANLAQRYNLAGQREKGLEVIARLHEWAPENWVSYWIKGIIHINQGNPEAAAVALEKGVIYSDPSPSVKPVYAYSLILAGRQEEADAILEEFENKAKEEYVSPFYLAQLYAAFGRNDEAFEYYDLAIEERDWLMFGIAPNYSPVTKELLSDPRWPKLVEKVGFSPD